MKRLSFIPTTILAAVLLSCNNHAVSPEIHWGLADTTSHDILWQIDSLSASGTLHDVAIVNDSLIYAVGELHPLDSTGQSQPGYYSMAEWNGSNWQFRRLYYTCQGCSVSPLPLTEIEGILIFSPTDIWLCMGSVFHWNGVDSVLDLSFSRLDLTSQVGMIDRLWGTSSTNLYGVGAGASVVHFDGSTWQQIQTETSFDFRGIWGSNDEILAVASDPHSATRSLIIAIKGNAVTLSDSTLEHHLANIWFSAGKKYFVVGDGIFTKMSLTDSLWTGKPLDLTNYYSIAIAGTDTNNVFVGGAFCDLLHYNGSTWKNYSSLLAAYGGISAFSLKGNLVVAVGSSGSRAVVFKAALP